MSRSACGANAYRGGRVWGRLVCVATAAWVASGLAAGAFWDPVTAQCRTPALEGQASAIDGDTMELTTAGGVRHVLRLVGVEAPELLQDCRDDGGSWPCGFEARATLEELVAGRALACLPCGHDDDGATLAWCRAGEADIGAAMVATGMATSPAFFSNALHASEVQARRAGRGLWRGDWVHPHAWRDGVRLGTEPCAGCLLPR